MIKSLPIENILSKESLSSKKSAKNRDSGFRDILTKTGGLHKQTREKWITDKSHDREVEKKDKSLYAKKANSMGFAAVSGHQEAKVKSIKTTKKADRNHTSDSLKAEDKGFKVRIRVAIEKSAIKHIQTKDKKVPKPMQTDKKEQKSPKLQVKEIDLNKTSSEKSKKANQESSAVKHQQSIKELSIRQDGTKTKKMETEKEKQLLKSAYELKNKKEAEKESIQSALHFKEGVKNRAKSQKNTKTTGTINSEEAAKFSSAQKTEHADVDKKAEKVNTKIKEKSNEKNGKGKNVVNTEHKSDTVNIQAAYMNKESGKKDTKIRTEEKKGTAEHKKPERVDIKTVNIEKIKDKYAKKLNIKKIEASQDRDASVSSQFKTSTDKPQTTGLKTDGNINGSNINIAPKKTVSTSTGIKIVKEADRSVKIKTIKDIRDNKVIKVTVMESENKQKTRMGVDAVLNPGGWANKKNKMAGIKTVAENITEVLRGAANSKVDDIVDKITDAADKSKDKKYNMKSDTLFWQVNAQTEIHGALSADNAVGPYPMDKVIEHIDKMLNMKPPFNNTITIKLNPPHIGVLTLQVKLSTDKNISAVITTDDKHVLRIVNSHMDGLKTYLNSQGIKIAHIDVHNGFNEQANFGGGQNQGMLGNNQQQSAGGNRFDSFGGTFANKEAENLKGEGVYENKVSLSGLDITV